MKTEYGHNIFFYGTSDMQNVLMNRNIRELLNKLHKYDTSIWQHAVGTACVSELLLDDMNIYGADREDVITAALLHDVGEIELPQALFKKEDLSKKDYERLYKHPFISAKMTGSFVSNHTIMMILSHHRTRDGRGYGIGIPDEMTEIVKVADVYVALSEPRPYRNAFSVPEALGIMDRLAETGDIDKKIYARLRKYLFCVGGAKQSCHLPHNCNKYAFSV